LASYLQGRCLLYHLSHTTTCFCFSYFSNKVSHFCPGPTWTIIILPIFVVVGFNHHPLDLTSWVAGIVCMVHCARFEA
jgi:hypothetical protein